MARREIERRLVSELQAVRLPVAVVVVATAIQAGAVVFFAWGVASSIAGLVAGDRLSEMSINIAMILVAGALRAVGIWLTHDSSARVAQQVMSTIHSRLLIALSRSTQQWLSTQRQSHILTVMGRGIDAMGVYYSNYLPQVVMSVVMIPVVIGALLFVDGLSALTVAVTLPLIPVFMVLIGWATQTAQDRQWRQLTSLSTGFLDIVEGIATLKIFNRAQRQLTRVRAMTDDYRRHTMAVLRMSFLSGFALELIASLSVAVVAVSIGIRLVEGHLDLGIGLFCLILVPEAYLPLRNVGAQYHAAAQGISAAEEYYTLLDTAKHGISCGTQAEPSALRSGDAQAIVLRDVRVENNSQVELPVVSASFARNSLTVLTGPSGVGKSSLIAALMSRRPYRGSIEWNPALNINGEHTWQQMSWVPQQTQLLSGTVVENIVLGHTGNIDDEKLHESARLAGLDAEILSSKLAGNGVGLSGGQSQRVALARAYYRALTQHTPVMVLDEPTSALDSEAEHAVIAGWQELCEQGFTLIVASHRAAVITAAHSVVKVGV